MCFSVCVAESCGSCSAVYFYKTCRMLINNAGCFKISRLFTVCFPLSESVTFSAGVYQFTASSSEGLLGLGSHVNLRPVKPWFE